MAKRISFGERMDGAYRSYNPMHGAKPAVVQQAYALITKKGISHKKRVEGVRDLYDSNKASLNQADKSALSSLLDSHKEYVSKNKRIVNYGSVLNQISNLKEDVDNNRPMDSRRLAGLRKLGGNVAGFIASAALAATLISAGLNYMIHPSNSYASDPNPKNKLIRKVEATPVSSSGNGLEKKVDQSNNLPNKSTPSNPIPKSNPQKPAQSHSQKPKPVENRQPALTYEQQKARDAKVAAAKKKDLEKCYDVYLVGKEREMDKIVPYIGTDDVQDFIPTPQKVVRALPAGNENVNTYRIKVEAPSFIAKKQTKLPDRTGKATELGPLGIYGNYASDEKGKVGSTNPDTNIDLAEERFTNAGLKIGDAFTACSFAKDKPPIGWDHAAKSSMDHLKNWGKSIADPLNPASKNYSGHAIPERAINFLGAIPAGALKLPTDILATVFANTSRRVVDRLIGAGDDVVEGLVNTFSAPGNFIPDYDAQRANTGFWRFGGNVGKGAGFENTLDPKKRILKGPIGYAETLVNVGSTAASFAGVPGNNNSANGFAGPAPIPVAPRVVRNGRVGGSGGN